MELSRCKWLSAFALIVLVGSLVAAQDPAERGAEFYFSDGAQIPLEPAEDWIAVRFASLDRKAQPTAGPQEVDFAGRRNLVRNRLSLLPVVGKQSAKMRGALAADLAAMPEVELVAPVYRGNGALMIVTDEFVASFAVEISEPEFDAINRRHGVEAIKTLRRGANTWLLRVKEGNALATANAYHGLAEVLYAHPDFVRVMPPRPPDIQPQDRRLVMAPDGSLLPPDTVVEKGRTDIRVVEPAVEVLPVRHAEEGHKLGPTPVNRVTIKGEDFEGAFPNDWTLYGSPTWDPESYRAYSGSRSGYCLGSSIDPPGPYASNASSWMVYGPFSLSDAIDARFDLQAWVETETSYDYLFIGASVDGSQFYGMKRSGGWASASGGDGWMNVALDLKRVPTLGDLTGETEVWVGLYFHTDNIYNLEGAYVDDIVVEKITGGYESLTSDEFDDFQWSLSNNQQLWGVDGADIQAVDAWGVTHGSDSITIAVFDEGVDLVHPDLASKMVTGYDATDGGGAGGPSGDDAHGTGCAGIAAAITDNSLGVAGIAREAKIMPVRIAYDDGYGNWITTDTWVADAIDWAVANGADVLSHSWGGGSPSTLITDAIADAKTGGRGGLGAVVVFAAGNDNGAVLYPASLDTVLAVAATSPCDERKAPTSCDGEWWWGSCHGPEVDIAAPGVHMYTTDISGSSGYDAGDYHYNFNGTSSATPVVAGVAALLLGQDPTMTAAEVEAQLMATADDLATPGWDEGTGFGRVNAYRALVETLPACYPLSIGHTGLGSDPAVMPPASPGCATGRYFEGETVTLSAVPTVGWIVNNWSGTDNNGSTSTTNTVTMPASSHSAQVHYAQIPCYTLTLGHSGSGNDPAVNLAASAGCSPGAYHADEVVMLVADPAAGWAIGGWSGTDDNASFAPSNTVTMPAANHAASVSYVSVPAGCYVRHRRHSGSGGDPTPTPWNSSGCPGGTHTAGETIALAADAAAGWTVGGWMGTDDDGSFLWANSLDMPARDHTVSVLYVTPTLVKDIRPGSFGAFDRSDWSAVDYTTPASIGPTLFFAANDDVHGMELWKSDGSEAGTVLVKDIRPGGGSAFPWSTSNTWFSQTFVNVNGILFFVADDGVHNYEVWKSDGTPAGTVMVKDIYNSWDKLPTGLIKVGGTLFFAHTDGVNGVELWKSDGTAAGTVMVKNINGGADSSSPQDLTVFGDHLIFTAFDSAAGREPWISDGTGPGTVMLKDINPTGNSYAGDFAEVGGELFFAADDGVMGKELWKSDGTTAGTVLLKEISIEGYGVNRGSYPSKLTDVGGTLYFTADDQVGTQVGHGEELWKSNGTEAGTVLVKDIWPDWKMSNPTYLTDLSGTLLFTARTPDQGLWGGELWRSDGTEPGTYMVKDTWPGENPINYWPERLMVIGGALMFVADNSGTGDELWRSDGTGAGTAMINDIMAGPFPSSPYWLTDAGGVLFFRANDGFHGREIWALLDDSTCHLLALNHTGRGANPVPDPTSSLGCDVGLFEAGEVVTLTASPDSGWFVGSWSGSDNDGSTSMVNTVTMPGVNHTVTVNYGAYPIFVDGFESGNTSAWSKTVP